MAKIEFYIGDGSGHIAALEDSAVPREGEAINIRKKTYDVEAVTWAVDFAADFPGAKLRANVILKPRS